jgi:hypothetical protein
MHRQAHHHIHLGTALRLSDEVVLSRLLLARGASIQALRVAVALDDQRQFRAQPAPSWRRRAASLQHEPALTGVFVSVARARVDGPTSGTAPAAQVSIHREICMAVLSSATVTGLPALLRMSGSSWNFGGGPDGLTVRR